MVGSVQEFQLGENSEGKHLHRLAREHAEKTGDGDYLLSVEYFIREEQRHARYLRHFLVSEGFGTVEGSWVDAAFRRLRRLANLEVSVGVLVTAEIIAKVYYAALEEATRSRMLRVICERGRRDEEMHVRFQAERLAILRHDRSRSGMALTRLLLRRLSGGVEEPRRGHPARRPTVSGVLAAVLGRVRRRPTRDGTGRVRGSVEKSMTVWAIRSWARTVLSTSPDGVPKHGSLDRYGGRWPSRAVFPGTPTTP